MAAGIRNSSNYFLYHKLQSGHAGLELMVNISDYSINKGIRWMAGHPKEKTIAP
jgi:hypothetical protein